MDENIYRTYQITLKTINAQEQQLKENVAHKDFQHCCKVETDLSSIYDYMVLISKMKTSDF